MREFTNPPLASAPPVGGLADAVFEHAQEDPLYIALGRKDDEGQWRDVTSAEFRDEVLALAKGLLAHGIRFGDRVAIMSRTRYEWTLFDFALWSIGAQVVPIYPTSSAEQVFWMLHDAQVSAAMVEHEDHAMTIATVIDRLPTLHKLWQLDAGAVQELYEAGGHIDDEVVHRHRRAVTPESTATIIYTSGTTGRPKGCVLSHANFMFESDTVTERWEPLFHSKRGDQAATLLFLPLAHVFGRMVQVAAIRGRVKFGHQPQLNAAALLPDLAAFQPTFFLAVPYIFEKVFNAARRKAEREGRAGPFEKAVEVRRALRGRGGGEGVGHRPRALGGAPGAAPAVRQARLLQDPCRDGRSGASTRCPAARRWTGGSACSSRAPACRSTRGTGSPSPRRPRPPTRPSAPGTAPWGSPSRARPCTSRTTARSG